MIHPYYKTPYVFQLKRSGELYTGIFYLVAGALTSLTDYSLFYLFFNVLQDGLLLATIIAYIGGLIVSFLLSRFWVFRKNASGQKLHTSMWRYGSLLVVNLIITYLLLWALEALFGLTPLLGKFVVWFFMIFWIYTANKFWVFKGPRKIKKFYFTK